MIFSATDPYTVAAHDVFSCDEDKIAACVVIEPSSDTFDVTVRLEVLETPVFIFGPGFCIGATIELEYGDTVAVVVGINDTIELIVDRPILPIRWVVKMGSVYKPSLAVEMV